MTDFVNNLLFMFRRLDAGSAVDVLLVALVFYALMRWLRGTQAMSLFRGVVLMVVILVLLTNLANLTAFSWLVNNSIPALLVSIPVIFAPELRRALERVGGTWLRMGGRPLGTPGTTDSMIERVTAAAKQLSARKHGALIVLRRFDRLDPYIMSGVRMDAGLSAELLLQIFYPNTPLHDGAAIVERDQLVAAACVVPLSASGILNRTPDRQMGLRHRAALGISEVSDAVAVVVSEETGHVAVAHGAQLTRKIELDQLAMLLTSLFPTVQADRKWWSVLMPAAWQKKEP